MTSFRRISSLICLGTLLFIPLSQAKTIQIPNPKQYAANQRWVSGNACGPTCLLMSFRAGAPSWKNIVANLPGTNDRQKIAHLIRRYAFKPSTQIPKRNRWEAKHGTIPADLTAIANDIKKGSRLPILENQIYFLKKRETHRKLLRRVHRDLARSMKKGFPPILNLRRFTYKKNQIPPNPNLASHLRTLRHPHQPTRETPTESPILHLPIPRPLGRHPLHRHPEHSTPT